MLQILVSIHSVSSVECYKKHSTIYKYINTSCFIITELHSQLTQTSSKNINLTLKWPSRASHNCKSSDRRCGQAAIVPSQSALNLNCVVNSLHTHTHTHTRARARGKQKKSNNTAAPQGTHATARRSGRILQQLIPRYASAQWSRGRLSP